MELNLLNEVYYGNNPILLQIEKEFKSMKSRIKDGNVSLETTDENIRISELLKELFGFTNVLIKYTTFFGTATMSGLHIFKVKEVINLAKTGGDNLEKGPYGVRYKKNAGVTVVIMINLAELHLLSEKELVAILLHEIGHNFFHKSVSGSLLFYIDIIVQLKDLEEEVISKSISQIIMMANLDDVAGVIYKKLIETINALDNKFFNYSLSIGQYIGEYFLFIKQISKSFGISKSGFTLKDLSLNILNSIKKMIDPFAWISKITRNKNEKFADHFVSSYGYSNYFATAITKVESRYQSMFVKDKKEYANSNIIILMTQIFLLPMTIIIYLDSPYPTTLQRINEQINFLKNELSKSDLDRSSKNELNKQLKECEKSLNDFLIIKNKNTVDPFIMRKVYSKFLYDIFGTDDYKELLSFTADYDHSQLQRLEKNKEV